MTDLTQRPEDLPEPVDDGGADHLIGMRLPDLTLRSTQDRDVALSGFSRLTVLYCYPRTGRPDEALPEGWDAIPGARGCTPQACSFRDHAREIAALGGRVFGLSTQDVAYQKEMADRLHLPYAVLSDAEFVFADAMRLPRFTAAGMVLLKRLTMIIEDGVVVECLYPVFPSDSDVAWTLDQLQRRQA